jgi:hypothetical protein
VKKAVPGSRVFKGCKELLGRADRKENAGTKGCAAALDQLEHLVNLLLVAPEQQARQ